MFFILKKKGSCDSPLLRLTSNRERLSLFDSCNISISIICHLPANVIELVAFSARKEITISPCLILVLRKGVTAATMGTLVIHTYPSVRIWTSSIHKYRNTEYSGNNQENFLHRGYYCGCTLVTTAPPLPVALHFIM